MTFFNIYQAPQIVPRRRVGTLQACYANDQPKKPEATQEPLKREGRYVGSVKWYSPELLHGYIALSNNGKDIIVLQKDLEDCGLSNLFKGQRVSFDVQKSGKQQQRKQRAVNIKIM